MKKMEEVLQVKNKTYSYQIFFIKDVLVREISNYNIVLLKERLLICLLDFYNMVSIKKLRDIVIGLVLFPMEERVGKNEEYDIMYNSKLVIADSN